MLLDFMWIEIDPLGCVVIMCWVLFWGLSLEYGRFRTDDVFEKNSLDSQLQFDTIFAVKISLDCHENTEKTDEKLKFIYSRRRFFKWFNYQTLADVIPLSLPPVSRWIKSTSSFVSSWFLNFFFRSMINFTLICHVRD